MVWSFCAYVVHVHQATKLVSSPHVMKSYVFPFLTLTDAILLQAFHTIYCVDKQCKKHHIAISVLCCCAHNRKTIREEESIQQIIMFA